VIVARANGDGSEAKFEKAGANKVIAPEVIGGQRMVGLVLRPGATEVIDTLLHADDQDNWLEQTTVFADSPLRDHSLGDAQIEDRTGVRVIAIRRADGTLVTNPQGNEMIMDQDILVCVGERNQFSELVALAQPAHATNGQV